MAQQGSAVRGTGPSTSRASSCFVRSLISAAFISTASRIFANAFVLNRKFEPVSLAPISRRETAQSWLHQEGTGILSRGSAVFSPKKSLLRDAPPDDSSSATVEQLELSEESIPVQSVTSTLSGLKTSPDLVLQRAGIDPEEEEIIRDTVPHRLVSHRDIFCNRELQMSQIKAVGFDMDFTLAQYTTAFDELAYEGAKKKLVEIMGYPEEVLGFRYDPTLFRRGLLVDKQLGNFIKIDKHKAVRAASHGSKPMPREERLNLYVRSLVKLPSFLRDSRFVPLNTLFQLVDAVLFAQLVDLHDSRPDLVEKGRLKNYEKMFADVHRVVDLCHNDGTIKDTVAEDPEKYIFEDKEVLSMLRGLKEAGKKVFLLTNSHWEYTTVVMNFVMGNKAPHTRTTEWLDLFDLIIVAAGKPAFLSDRRDLFRVDPKDGRLLNTCPDLIADVDGYLAEGKVFQAGNWKTLNNLLNLQAGREQLLYVGDHMYSDIIEGRKSLGWRTCLVIPELAYEVRTQQIQKKTMAQLQELRGELNDVDLYLDALVMEQRKRRKANDNSPSSVALDAEIREVRIKQEEVTKRWKKLNLELHAVYHPTWGELFKAGYQKSQFAKQVQDYSCVYTARVSNLGLVSGSRSFRPPRERMPHESVLDFDDLPRLLEEEGEEQETEN
uniref:5'-nucleotidase n=1 Tax=Chromera velia CCMP2878 TaxID=1169474 RepID=A0A0G4H1H6_9ALVE|mmetsp:Transcript_31759/g.62895  ORF Transcript_31759/g.62895 Transcript_31759/m.62895 type:complete len:662 (-) Transcript_31759:1355-3340(-)|eukprot:Cvel_5546.t1-p1 / transcript=Cvel_5546.t1 / gene=Cvel_5546 / organism=Chromera_velia_CCMP2878 / gene_product=Cytosolic purine 5'-nucleotidase, putative / transcript_product=Cytosolic purine 5'-nucleotidase, putative / location=Cvel_scaffold260:37950-40346(-) / protein_length=661 / sequence_SO=supercontig / SO=protein_coding / is_pseudo=false